MSYYSGYGTSYGNYTRYGNSSLYAPSYDYSKSRYESRTYDFGTSSFLSKSYGSSSSSYSRKSSDYSSPYSRRYDEYSWKAKDLLTDNPHNKEVDVHLRETTKEKREFTSVNESEDKEELANVEENNKENSSNNDYSKDYLGKDYSRDIYSKENNTREDSSNLLNGYSRKQYSRDIYSKEDNTREDSDYLLKGYSRKDYSSDYTRKNQSKGEDNNVNGDYPIRGSKNNYLKDYQSKTDGKNSKVDSYGADYNINYTNDKKDGGMDEVDTTVKNPSLRYGRAAEKEKTSHHLRDGRTAEKEKTSHHLRDGRTAEKEKTSHYQKKVFNFEEDDDVFIKPQNDNSLQSERETLFSDVKRPYSNKAHENVNSNPGTNERATHGYSPYKPRDYGLVERDGSALANHKPENHRFENPKSKSASDVTDSGPLRMHRQGVAKFISAVPDQKRYISSVNFLPDRIELRFTGAALKEQKMKRCRSISDLYEITVEPEHKEQQQTRRLPWEDTIQCQKQDLSYSYDSENEILHYTKHKHEHTKEMYITQYTHHFDPDEPRTHIAGWKCDVEPNGIPHERSRMCVLKSPVVSGSRRRVPRPKSAPPQLSARPVSPAETVRSLKVDVYERGSFTLPRSRAKQEEFFFHNSVDESVTEAEVSSLGYAPSDDTSDSSAFFFNDSQYIPRYQYEDQQKDLNLSYSKPRLIRLSAEFPGIRNLEKMRRKRQSMGSYSSAGSRSSVGKTPPPRNGEYGFFVALTSGGSRKPQRNRQNRHSFYY